MGTVLDRNEAVVDVRGGVIYLLTYATHDSVDTPGVFSSISAALEWSSAELGPLDWRLFPDGCWRAIVSPGSAMYEITPRTVDLPAL